MIVNGWFQLCQGFLLIWFVKTMETTNNNILHVNLTVHEDDILSGASQILKVVRPNWDQNEIKYKFLTNGITNKLVKCKLDNVPEQEVVLIRIYGKHTEILIDRKAEIRNILLLNKAGLAPSLYATFNNGLAYEYVPGNTPNDSMVTQPKIYELIAEQMAKLHKANITEQAKPQPMLWNKLYHFLNLVCDEFKDKEKQERYLQTVIQKPQIRKEIDILKEKLSKLESPVVFCHNDLLLGNIIYTPEKSSVTFIDYEYAAFNYQAFDIGNHFAEFAGIDDIDYSRYPSKKFQLHWLRKYLQVYTKGTFSEKDVEILYVQVNQFMLTSHIFWGLWALIQAEHSMIDFDFLGYAAIRFNEYFARKDEFLNLEVPR